MERLIQRKRLTRLPSALLILALGLPTPSAWALRPVNAGLEESPVRRELETVLEEEAAGTLPEQEVAENLRAIRDELTLINRQLELYQQIRPSDLSDQAIRQYTDAIHEFNGLISNGEMTADQLNEEFLNFHGLLGREELIQDAGSHDRKGEAAALFQQVTSEEGKKRWARNPVKLAAHLFVALTNLQGFKDGNKRAANLMMNYVLLKAGRPPFILTPENVVRYKKIVNPVRSNEDDVEVREREFEHFLRAELQNRSAVGLEESVEPYVGTHERVLDDKSRVVIPAAFKSLRDAQTILVWMEEDKTAVGTTARYIRLQPEKSVQARHRTAVSIPVRDQARILIPADGLESLGVSPGDTLVFLGANDHVELWSQQGWQEYQQESAEKEPTGVETVRQPKRTGLEEEESVEELYRNKDASWEEMTEALTNHSPTHYRLFATPFFDGSSGKPIPRISRSDLKKLPELSEILEKDLESSIGVEQPRQARYFVRITRQPLRPDQVDAEIIPVEPAAGPAAKPSAAGLEEKRVVVFGQGLGQRFSGLRMLAEQKPQVIVDEGDPSDTLTRAIQLGDVIHFYGGLEEGQVFKNLIDASGIQVSLRQHDPANPSDQRLLWKILAGLGIPADVISAGLEELYRSLELGQAA